MGDVAMASRLEGFIFETELAVVTGKLVNVLFSPI